jgi:hypothetical protein
MLNAVRAPAKANDRNVLFEVHANPELKNRRIDWQPIRFQGYRQPATTAA